MLSGLVENRVFIRAGQNVRHRRKTLPKQSSNPMKIGNRQKRPSVRVRNITGVRGGGKMLKMDKRVEKKIRKNQTLQLPMKLIITAFPLMLEPVEIQVPLNIKV